MTTDQNVQTPEGVVIFDREKYKLMLERPVRIDPCIQGDCEGILLDVVIGTWGQSRDKEVFIVQMSGRIHRLIDWRIYPMTDTDLNEALAQTADEQTAQEAPKRSRKRATPLAEDAKVEIVPADKAAKPVKEKVAKTASPCHCGCGRAANSLFVPGHDMKAKSILIKVIKGQQGTETIPAVLSELVKDNDSWSQRFGEALTKPAHVEPTAKGEDAELAQQ